MPAVSKAQNRLMQAVAANPKLAKQMKIPQSVAKEYVRETKSMKNKPEKKK
jgi:hypothetical protein